MEKTGVQQSKGEVPGSYGFGKIKEKINHGGIMHSGDKRKSDIGEHRKGLSIC